MSIGDNINSIKLRIDNTCNKIGRDADEVILVAVSKTVPAAIIKIAIGHGIEHIGENRVQEAEHKFDQLGKIAHWHLVGHLQSNKVKKALQIFDLIHSVDSYHLAQEISKRAVQLERTVDCLLEVNTSGEASKFGVNPEDTLELAKQISLLPAIQIMGLMTVGAFLSDPEDVRPCFKLLKEVKDEIQSKGVEHTEMKYLSMGMTNDFEIAIEEGANMIRVGRAIFGER